jgi:hypothetical protein
MKTVKARAIELLLQIDHIDREGCSIGLPYAEIEAILKREIPIIEYPGPHRGKPNAISVKEIQKFAYSLFWEDGIRVPRRPRKRPATRH